VVVCAQFGKAVSLTEGMVKSGTRPDQFTFTAIVAACQRANEAEVAFEVFRYNPCAVLCRAVPCCAVPCCAVLDQGSVALGRVVMQLVRSHRLCDNFAQR